MKWTFVAAFLTAALYGAFVLLLWNARDRDVSRFIVLAADSVDASKVPRDVTVQANVSGYDGTAFYRLALDPFTRTRSAFGITLDDPSYRQQRIGYPLIVWLLSFGGRFSVPWLLVLVNVGAVVGMAVAGSRLADALSVHPLWGIVFPLYPGFLYSLSRDLCEPLACMFALVGIVAVTRRNYATAGALFAAAALTRETVLLLVVGVAVAGLFGRNYRAVVAAIIPIGAYGAWQWILAGMWGHAAHGVELSPFTAPFVEYWHALVASSSLRHLHRLHFFELAYLTIVVLLAAIGLRSAAPAWRVAFVVYVALAATLPVATWEDDAAYMRVLAELFVVAAAVVLPSRVRRWMLAAPTAIVWCYLSSHLIKYS